MNPQGGAPSVCLVIALLAFARSNGNILFPMEWTADVSSQGTCGKYCAVNDSNITSALKTVVALLRGRTDNSTQTTSRLDPRGEVNELCGWCSSGERNTTTGVYCGTEKLLSDPSLEQTLSKIKEFFESMALMLKFTSAYVKCNDAQEAIFDQNSLDHLLCYGSSQINATLGLLLNQWKHNNVTIKETAMILETVITIANHTLKILNTAYNKSCQDVLNKAPNSDSGFYTLFDVVTGKVFKHYCHFQNLCNSSGPWRRVAYLNMSDSEQNCPNQFEEYNVKGVRACGRQNTPTGSCQSIIFPTHSSYFEVCGRVIGYQLGFTHGFWAGKTINEHYVDGVSLSRGFPREHLWSFAAQTSDGYYNFPVCPCSGDDKLPSTFVEKDFFCESGSHGLPTSPQLYIDDPLWDGQGCGQIESGCCQVPDIPWFHKVLATPTNDDIELRMCGNLATAIGNAPVGLYEIYVQEA